MIKINKGVHIIFNPFEEEREVNTFNILKHKMNKGGLFIIEDVNCLDTHREHFLKLHPNCQIIDNRSLQNRYDDVLIVYQF
jgi:hypothetical protein